jgi:D-alanyl-lipoteichoic acid acyltransferase DltB (MBOAT superfamily)
LFFAVVYPLYLVVPQRWRYQFLLAASYYFYMCSIPWYLTAIIAITLVDFWVGIRIEESRTANRRRGWLLLSLMSNLGILIGFKYAGFLTLNINELFGTGLPVWRWALPLGISFHTFQAIAYTVEVYSEKCAAERNLLRYALYVAFFPQMVAGPIERPKNLLPQFAVHQPFRYDDFVTGIRLALWGAFKKLVVADTIAQVVNNVYGFPDRFRGPVLIIGTILFAVQIYCDFSGYSDIALGIARMMGYRLMVNFRQPYFARSVGEFWRRWHISLSSWFRDYLYIPLGGSRVTSLRTAFNLFVVFLVSGFWHGANWTFACWGALHGLFLVFSTFTRPIRERIRGALSLPTESRVIATGQMLTTFSLVTIAWVFFRANSVRDALFIISHFTDWNGFRLTDVFSLGLPRFELVIAACGILTIAFVEWGIANQAPMALRLWARPALRWTAYYACTLSIIFFGTFERITFIYFQF